MIRAVIFDLGGVLVRTEDRQPRRLLAERLGLSYEAIDELVFTNASGRQATVGELTTHQHWLSVMTALGLPEQEMRDFQAAFWGGDRLDTELVDLLRTLRGRYTTALLSNAWDNLRQVLTDHWRIADAFDELIISAEVGLAKPDPRIYRLALERLAVLPHEAVFVDDVQENIAAAQAVGLLGIRFTSSRQAQDDLARLLGGNRG